MSRPIASVPSGKVRESTIRGSLTNAATGSSFGAANKKASVPTVASIATGRQSRANSATAHAKHASPIPVMKLM